jgi:NAD(P)-dependent dehydrogenase (short-subunit alcohol dehydrogenase family)
VGDFDLSGHVAVVTGAGRGIGEGIAREFARAGAAVVLAARTEREIECVAASICAHGGRAIAVRTDVTDSFALGSLATAAVEEFGHLDVWVNNAGGVEVGRPLVDLRRREWDDMLALNLTAVWNASAAAAEQMDWGSIINVSSMTAYGARPGLGHYAACRAAVISLTRTMAVELAPDIRVNAVAPGRIPTQRLFDAADVEGLDVERLDVERVDVERVDLEARAGRLPLGPGPSADVAAAVLYLASPAAKWVTGETLRVSGGPIVA